MSILFEAVSVLQTPPLTNYTSCPSIRVPNLIKYMTHIGISTVDYLHSLFILVFLLAIFLCVLFLCIILHFFPRTRLLGSQRIDKSNFSGFLKPHLKEGDR